MSYMDSINAKIEARQAARASVYLTDLGRVSGNLSDEKWLMLNSARAQAKATLQGLFDRFTEAQSEEHDDAFVGLMSAHKQEIRAARQQLEGRRTLAARYFRALQTRTVQAEECINA